MYAYETFAYLDVQKTGSTFIAKLLEDFAREKVVFARKHRRMKRREDGIDFYFISCRDPLDQLLSLYSFGCTDRGHTNRRLRRRGLGDFYDRTEAGFERWLFFILDPANAAILGEDYDESGIAPFAGFMTFRFVVLSLPKPIRRLAKCHTPKGLLRMYERRNAAKAVVRFERLNQSMRDLVDGPLRHRLSDADAAIAWIDRTAPVNPSVRIDRERNFSVSDAAKRRIEEREWFLFDVLGYPRYG